MATHRSGYFNIINMYQLISECTLIQLGGVIILITKKKSVQDARR